MNCPSKKEHAYKQGKKKGGAALVVLPSLQGEMRRSLTVKIICYKKVLSVPVDATQTSGLL